MYRWYQSTVEVFTKRNNNEMALPVSHIRDDLLLAVLCTNLLFIYIYNIPVYEPYTMV